MSNTVRVIDKGWKKIQEQYRKFASKPAYVTIGVHNDVYYLSGISIAEVATWLHEGTRKMPARPFIRRVVNMNSKRYANLQAKILKQVYKGGNLDLILNQSGSAVMVDISASIAKAPEWAAPLSPSTIESKTVKGGRVLFDSGSLFRSIGYQTVKGGIKSSITRTAK